MNIFFDVDYTIQGADGSLRPRTQETFELLKADGHTLYVWSGVGVRTAEVQRHELGKYVTGIYQKPLEDFEATFHTFGVTTRPDFVIDDHPQIVAAFGGFICKPYYFRNPGDDEMDIIYAVISDVAEIGHSQHTAYRPGTSPNS